MDSNRGQLTLCQNLVKKQLYYAHVCDFFLITALTNICSTWLYLANADLLIFKLFKQEITRERAFKPRQRKVN